MKPTIGAALLVASMLAGQAALAQGIPVFDAASVAQQVQQVSAWARQFQQMQQQFSQLESTFNSLNGVRGMGSIANNPGMRNYLPPEYQDMLNNRNMPSISGSIPAIREAAKILDINQSGLHPASATGKAFAQAQNQNALNRAVGEEGYRQASQRFAGIQQLLDKVNAAPEQKDILDLQARIQAEQIMLQNEQNKLTTMAYLAQVQRDIQQQQAREQSMKATDGPLAPGW